jgi:hypothetical protein
MEVLVRRPAPPGIRPFLEKSGQFALLRFSSLPVSLLIPALRGLSQKSLL